MQGDFGVAAVAHVISLAVAPVFLLSGIGAMLAVMTQRLARVIDRARKLEARLEQNPQEEETLHKQFRTLSRRAKLVGRAITLCTITALLVCAVIAILFLGATMGFDASFPVAILFVVAMLSFFIGLLIFLREIMVATANLRIGPK
jgi:Na+/melibiose symporter-like transporter